MDIISDLPDSILSHILSLLPIKTAISTYILSKRWNNIFPFGHSPIYLHLDDSLQNEPNSSITSFKDFVDKLFRTTLRDVPCVEQLNLECKKEYNDSDVISWVSAALRINVRQLMLTVSLYDTEVLFDTLYGCTTLVCLKLVMKCKLVVPYNFNLPSVKGLYLHDLEFDDSDGGGSVNQLIEGCLLLEELHLVGCDVSSITELIIHGRFLKHLVLEKNWLNSGKTITILWIHALNLEHLKYSDHVACGYYISPFKSLISAHIDVGPTTEHFQEGYYDDYFEFYEDEVDDDELKYYTDVSKIVVACSNTKQLYLTPCSVTALYETSVMPQFQNMIRFVLGIVRSTTWIALACLLESAPNLEHLEFQQEFVKSNIGFEDFERLLPSLPVCVEQRLKRIEFWEFDVKGDEIKLLNYFLRNGKVLEQVELDEVEIAIKKQNDGVIAVDSSYASTSCDIAPSSSHDPRLAEIITQMKTGRAKLDRAERAKEQVNQFRQQLARHRKQSTSLNMMLREVLQTEAPLATMNLTMSELLESKEQLASMNLSDLSESESYDIFESKEFMINNNQSMIETMSTLIQHGFLPTQPPPS